jgi:hypothetical protein
VDAQYCIQQWGIETVNLNWMGAEV